MTQIQPWKTNIFSSSSEILRFIWNLSIVLSWVGRTVYTEHNIAYILLDLRYVLSVRRNTNFSFEKTVIFQLVAYVVEYSF